LFESGMPPFSTVQSSVVAPAFSKGSTIDLAKAVGATGSSNAEATNAGGARA
jgi:hypothetical protein